MSRERFALSQIPGLAWLKNNKVIENPIRPIPQDLNQPSSTRMGTVNPQIYPARGEGIVNGIDLAPRSAFPSHFSRGCMASHILFELMIWKGYRWRNGKLVADEIESPVNRFGAKHFVFKMTLFQAVLMT